MDDKNPRLGPRPDEELLGGRANEQVTGRAGNTSAGSPAQEYSGPNITGDPGTETRAHTSRPGATRPSTTPGIARTGARREDWDEDEADPEAAARARQIRADINRTRSNMSETVDAIQDRLSPSNIASNAAETVRNAASETARQVADSDSVQYVRSNPIPSAMVAIGVGGLAWMLFGRSESPRRYRRQPARGRGSWRRPDYDWSDYEDRIYSADRSQRYEPGTGYSARSGSYGDRYRSGAETGRDLAGKAGGMADDAQRRARQVTRRARSGMQRTWDTSPLLVGAAALVAGAIIGAAVPETERENEWLGETRDEMVESVQESVRETVGKVQDAASAAVGLAGGSSSSNSSESQNQRQGPDTNPSPGSSATKGSNT
jgi:hypothetical protein